MMPVRLCVVSRVQPVVEIILWAVCSRMVRVATALTPTIRAMVLRALRRVSRLSRSTKQLCEIIDVIRDKHLRLVIVGSITIDCRNGQLDPMTAAFLQMAGVFSELELKMIRERVKSGMANAKAKGKQIGRKKLTRDELPDNFFKHYSLYTQGNITKTELSRLLNVSRPTLDHWISVAEAG